MSENQDFLEQIELDVLLEKGTQFSVAKRSLLRFIGKKQRTFHLQQPFLGTLDHLANQYIKLTFDKDTFADSPVEESKHILQENAQRCARIVAIAVLNDFWGITLFTGLLAKYLLWHLTPEELFDLTITIDKLSNLPAFIHSIRLMAATPRMTTPALMERLEKSQN